jgi:23S rRNA pseudouridine1911/1915/1917 synthase
LDGLRLDVAISRLFGFSRTTAADLIDTGQVNVNGSPAPRSSKVHGGSLLEVTMPEPEAPRVDPEPVAGRQ